MKTKVIGPLCAIAGMINVAEAQLVDGQTIGVDFGVANPVTNDFIEYAFNAGAVAITKDVTGASVAGSVTVTGTGFTGQNGDATENGGEDPVFNTSNLEDWIGFPASASITIGGLDDALEYELVIGAGFVNQNGRTTYTADGQSVSPDPQSANPFGTLSNLQTDGSGNLVISLNKDVIVVTVSALTLTASTPVVNPTNSWQTDGSGDWSTPANWAPGVPNAAEAIAQFDSALPLTGPLTATLDVPVTIGELDFDSSQAITIAGGNTLTFDNGGTAGLNATAGSHVISADVSLGGALDATLDPGTSVDISGALSGLNTLTVLGGGGLTLSGDLSGLTSGLIANGGNLTVPSGSTATGIARINTKGGGAISISGSVTLASNASFGTGAGATGTTGSVTVNAGGELNIGNGSGFTGLGGADLAGQTGLHGNGTLTVAGGTVNVGAPGAANGGAGGLDARNLWMHPYGDGGGTSSVNLDGGLLSMSRPIQRGSSGTSIFNFNGGTLQAAAGTAGNLLINMTRVNVRDGGGTIDTQGNNINWAFAVEHSDIGGDAATDGGLTKLGSGTLTLGGANTYTGPTTVSEGTLGMTGTFTSDVTVADGAGISGTGSTTGSLTLGATTGASLEVDGGSATGVSVGDLTLNGVTTLTVPVGPGPFAIATYSGTLTDANGGTLGDSFTVAGGQSGTIVDNAGTIEFTPAVEDHTWTGATSADWQIGGPDANWTSSSTFFSNGDGVTFDDSGANKAVNIAADVGPASVDVNNSAGNDYSFSGAAITGTTGIVKSGTGGLTLLNANTNSGTTTIDGGTLTLGNGGTTGSLGSGAVVNNSVLTYNRSDNIVLSNAVSGSGSVTKAGAGSLTINAAKTYTGGTTVSEGTLIFSGSGSTSTAGGIVVENGGTMQFDRNDTWGNHLTTATPVITIDTGGVVQSNNKYTSLIDLVFNGGTLSANDGVTASFPTFALKGTVTVNATAGGSVISTTGAGDFNTVAVGSPGLVPANVTVFDVADGAAASDLTVSAPLSNNAGLASDLTKTGDGTMNLTATNTYTGNTTVTAGTLSLGNGTVNSNLADGADVSVATGAVLNLDYVGTDTVDELFLGGAGMPAGTWGATGSGATHVDDTFFTGSGTLTVSAAASPYAIWATANSLNGSDALATADTESPTPDGLVQLLEFAFGTDPGVSYPGSLAVTDGSTFMPGQPLVEVIFQGGNPVKLRFVRRKDHVAAGLTYTPKFTDSTGAAIPDPAAPVPTVVSTMAGDYEVAEVPFPLFDSLGKKATALVAAVEVTLD